jgi:hypothetical protein
MGHEKSSFRIQSSTPPERLFSILPYEGGGRIHVSSSRFSHVSSLLLRRGHEEKNLLPSERGQDEGGRRKNPFFCRYHPHPGLPRRCKKIHFPPPPCPSPVKGEGISLWISIFFPYPLAGEGRVRGNISIFSQLAPARGRGSRKPSG